MQNNNESNQESPEISISPFPPILYHYCGVDAFFGMVRSGVVQLTDSYALNDYRENTWVIPFIRDTIEELKTDETSEFLKEVAASYDLNCATPYVASFSEGGDVLSQWRAYSDDGKGIALGINPVVLGIKYQLPITSKIVAQAIGLHPTIYDSNIQKNIVKQILETELNNFIEKKFDRANAVINASMGLRRHAPIFKNPAFQEELEWRIIHTPMILGDRDDNITMFGNISDLKFRSTGNKIISYFESPLSMPAGDNPILEVMLGPKCSLQNSTVNMLLSSNGYRKVKISRSKASYR